jgi:hypothetical protein
MRFARGDMIDHIVSHKNDHGPWWRHYRALQRQECLEINFREIFGAVRFSTFEHYKQTPLWTMFTSTERPNARPEQDIDGPANRIPSLLSDTSVRNLPRRARTSEHCLPAV